MPINITNRRELFVDGFLVENFSGGAALRLHPPTPREIALNHDAPWEGSGSGYHSVFQDGDLYRMYYKAWQITVTPRKVEQSGRARFCCYAESDDGIHWRKPELGLHEFEGSTANNIVFADSLLGEMKVDAAHPAVFKDANPDTAPDALYKAIIRTGNPAGVIPFQSPDGLRWTPMSDQPVITDGAFDSQNLAFWDEVGSQYRAYWRYFTDEKTTGAKHRAIRTATSPDLIHWENQADLRYIDSPSEELYTNQIKPYYRAPHLLLGFPARYVERGWSASMCALPDLQHRQWRAQGSERYGTALSEGLLMAGRDGVTFKRWNEAFLRPGPERPGTWNYGHQYIAWHLVETASELTGAPNELSLYATENYWTGAGGTASSLRRYTLRLDGFVSVQAPMSGGEVTTKPVCFAGRQLNLNFATSAAGSLRVEIQDENGKPLPGFALKDCPPLFGDSIERAAQWNNGSDVSTLAGQPVRLRFALQNADLYSFQFNGELDVE